MDNMKPRCTHCGSLNSSSSSHYTDKAGNTFKNYSCRDCGRNFSQKPRKFAFSQKQEAIDAYMATGSNQKAARHINCSAAQVIKWRKEFVQYGLIEPKHAPKENRRMVAE